MKIIMWSLNFDHRLLVFAVLISCRYIEVMWRGRRHVFLQYVHIPGRKLTIFYGLMTNLRPYLVASCIAHMYITITVKNMVKRKCTITSKSNFAGIRLWERGVSTVIDFKVMIDQPISIVILYTIVYVR